MTAVLRWSSNRVYVTQHGGAPEDPAVLGPRQLSGELCALCRGDLAPLARTRPVGRLRVDVGTVRESICELWACAPDCGTVGVARLRIASQVSALGGVWPP